MNILERLEYIRIKAYNLKGSYEDSYIYLMAQLDNIILELQSKRVKGGIKK